MSTLTHLAPGFVFAHDYRVVRPLAEGGMGSVYLVEQLSTGRERALKLMHPQFVADPTNRRRFADEARAGSRIESDHVVEVIASGVDDASGVPWLAMELLQGETLYDRVAKRGPVAPAEAYEILRQLCHALGAAHRAGIVHRDIKPENVFLATTRREDAEVMVKVLDFGIAKVIQDAHSVPTGGIGTPLWMAPEQTESGGPVGPQTDVWAVGLVAFFLLTGRNYWLAAGTSVQATMRELLFEPLPAASARAAQFGLASLIPFGFDDWFARTVHRDAAARFPDASVAAQTMESALLGPTPARTMPMAAMTPSVPSTVAMPAFQPAVPVARTMVAVPPPPVAAKAPPPRSRVPMIVGAVLVLGAGGVALAFGLRSSSPAPEVTPVVVPTSAEPVPPAAPTPAAPAPVVAPAPVAPAPVAPAPVVAPTPVAPVRRPTPTRPVTPPRVTPTPTPTTPTPTTPTPATPAPTPATPAPTPAPTPTTPTSDVPSAPSPSAAQAAALNQLIRQGAQVGRERLAQQLEQYLAQNPNAPDAAAIRQRITALRAPPATP